MANSKKKRGAAPAHPDLGDSLTVQRIPEVKKALLDAVETGGRVELDLSRVTEVDLTGLQLLCSAHRWSAERGVELAIASDGPALRAAAQRGGFARHKGCRGDCLWSAGGG